MNNTSISYITVSVSGLNLRPGSVYAAVAPATIFVLFMLNVPKAK